MSCRSVGSERPFRCDWSVAWRWRRQRNRAMEERAHSTIVLGMEEAFSNRVSPQDEYELKSLLQEERYFVILMAYDYPSVKRGKPELVWSTRYSIRAYGQNFEDAIKGMNVVAGDFFGKNLKGLSRKRVDDASHVEMGDIEVIDDAPTPSDKTN